MPVFRSENQTAVQRASQLPELDVHFPAHARPNVLGEEKKYKISPHSRASDSWTGFYNGTSFQSVSLHIRGQSLKNYALKFPAIPEITARSTSFPTESGFNLACIHHFLPISCFGPKLLHSSSQKTKVGHAYIREQPLLQCIIIIAIITTHNTNKIRWYTEHGGNYSLVLCCRLVL